MKCDTLRLDFIIKSCMKNIKFALLVPVLAFSMLFGGGQLAHAQLNLNQNLNEVGSEAGLENADLMETLGRLINVVLGLLGIILLLIILYAGFLWMTAGGNSDQVEKAKKLMINAVIGLVIMLAAYAISNFVITSLGEASLT